MARDEGENFPPFLSPNCNRSLSSKCILTLTIDGHKLNIVGEKPSSQREDSTLRYQCRAREKEAISFIIYCSLTALFILIDLSCTI